MSRRGDGIKPYKVEGKTMYLARVRVHDDRGILREISRSFADKDAAKLWRADKTINVKLGKIGKELEHNKLVASIKFGQLVRSRQEQMLSDKEENERNGRPTLGSNEYDMLDRFLKDAICNKFIGDIDHTDLDDYVERRKKKGAGLSTIDRELNPVRTLCDLARRGKLPGEFRGQYLEFDPFKNFEIGEYKSHRDRWLKTLDEDRQIYDAIERQCRTDLLRRRWLTFVVLALSTGLRRRVMLNLKWDDIDIEAKLIRIKETYWSGKKKAPPYVPISKNLEHHLDMYYVELPKAMKEPTDRLFPYTESGCETYWDRIIERTTLYEIVVKNGKERKDYINIHALRHTCETRYDDKPYKLSPKAYGYLLRNRRLNHEDRSTKTQQNYNHWDDRRHREMCDDIRKEIDAGDAILERQLKEQKKRRSDRSASLSFFLSKRIGRSPLSKDYQDQKVSKIALPTRKAIKKVKLVSRNSEWTIGDKPEE